MTGMAAVKRGRTLSLPTEHGALVSLAAGGVLAVIMAPQPPIAFATFALFLLAHLARGPTERRARRFRPRRWDLAAMLGYTTAAIATTYVVATVAPVVAVVAAGCALLLLGGGAVAQVMRVHRSLAVELGGMAMCGIASGVAIVGGGGDVGLAAVAAFILAAYAASSVLLVRGQLRKLTPKRSLHHSRLALALLIVGAAVAATYHLVLGLAFVPRASHVTVHCFVAARPTSPYKLAAIETAQLALFIALVGLLAS